MDGPGVTGTVRDGKASEPARDGPGLAQSCHTES